MEVQIQELIDKIKADGVGEAEKNKAAILSTAQQQAADIVNAAKKEAEQLLTNAKADADKFKATGKQAIIQAGRDLILNLRSEITKIFDAILAREIQGSFSAEFLPRIIADLIHSWAEKGRTEVDVLLSVSDQEKIRDTILSLLRQEFKKGVEIKAAPDITAGFRISEKEGSAYYDLSDQGIAESLKPLLNAGLAACIDEALK